MIQSYIHKLRQEITHNPEVFVRMLGYEEGDEDDIKHISNVLLAMGTSFDEIKDKDSKIFSRFDRSSLLEPIDKKYSSICSKIGVYMLFRTVPPQATEPPYRELYTVKYIFPYDIFEEYPHRVINYYMINIFLSFLHSIDFQRENRSQFALSIASFVGMIEHIKTGRYEFRTDEIMMDESTYCAPSLEQIAMKAAKIKTVYY